MDTATQILAQAPEWTKVDILGTSIAVFFFIIIAEMFWSRRRKNGIYELKDTATSLLMGSISLITDAAYAGVHLAIVLLVYEARVFDIGWSWWAMILCFFAVDFAYYWGHRLNHEHRLWWASHVIHHSSQHFNGSTALRQSWTGLLNIGFFLRLPIVFIGFHPAMVIFFIVITAAYQLWVHTEMVRRIGPFEWILNTASHHRVHHASNPCYLDSNHGGFLIIWDRMFGTFVAERDDEPCEYGIVSNVGTFNLFRVALHEWAAIARDVASARSVREVIGYIFGPRGWSPDGSRQTSRSIKAKWAQETRALVPAE